MKKLLRLAGALALMLALTAPVVSQAEETTLYMPRKLEKLGVPELPQLPFLKAWSDCIVLGDPCPLVLDPDGYLHVQFSFPVDECLVMHGGGVQEFRAGRRSVDYYKGQNHHTTAAGKIQSAECGCGGKDSARK